MEFAFLGAILGMVVVILVRVSYIAKDIREIRELMAGQER
jgi:hypothetical protein